MLNNHQPTAVNNALFSLQANQTAAILPVSQVSFTIESDTPKKCFEGVRNLILKWRIDQSGISLPEKAMQGQSFELHDVSTQRASAVFLEEPVYWAAQLDDTDNKVAKRNWVTEVGLAVKGNQVHFGCRLTCVSHGDNPPFMPSQPKFIRQIALKYAVRLDGRPISSEPWLVNSNERVGELVQLIRDRSRTRNVIVFSLPETSENKNDAVMAMGYIRAILERTMGASHVVILTGPSAFEFSEAIGVSFSVFNRAVRTYRPGFDENEDQPFDHPIAFARTVENWPNGGKDGFESFLITQALKIPGSRHDQEQALPSFRRVKRREAELKAESARTSNSSNDELLEISEEENRDLKTELDASKQEYNSLLEIAEQERDEALSQVGEVKDQAVHLRARVSTLESTIKKGKLKPNISIPKDLSALKKWADTHLTGSVYLHGRAIRDAKRSTYSEPKLIFKALLLLKDFYVPMRIHGGTEKRQAYKNECKKLQLVDDQCFPGSRAHEQGDEYFVRYSGKKRELERHLKKGNSKDARHCFRLYFFWDEEDQQVIVGSLPAHLKTRQT